MFIAHIFLLNKSNSRLSCPLHVRPFQTRLLMVTEHCYGAVDSVGGGGGVSRSALLEVSWRVSRASPISRHDSLNQFLQVCR